MPNAETFGQNPFEALSSEGLPAAPESALADAGRREKAKPARKNRGRVDIIRQKAGRGGKTVTVVKGFVGSNHQAMNLAMRQATPAGRLPTRAVCNAPLNLRTQVKWPQLRNGS
jgi:hypothetical protein